MEQDAEDRGQGHGRCGVPAGEGNTRFCYSLQESFQSRRGGLLCGGYVPIVPTEAINGRLEHL
jgi:hypothetical protein